MNALIQKLADKITFDHMSEGESINLPCLVEGEIYEAFFPQDKRGSGTHLPWYMYSNDCLNIAEVISRRERVQKHFDSKEFSSWRKLENFFEEKQYNHFGRLKYGCRITYFPYMSPHFQVHKKSLLGEKISLGEATELMEKIMDIHLNVLTPCWAQIHHYEEKSVGWVHIVYIMSQVLLTEEISEAFDSYESLCVLMSQIKTFHNAIATSEVQSYQPYAGGVLRMLDKSLAALLEHYPDLRVKLFD